MLLVEISVLSHDQTNETVEKYKTQLAFLFLSSIFSDFRFVNAISCSDCTYTVLSDDFREPMSALFDCVRAGAHVNTLIQPTRLFVWHVPSGRAKQQSQISSYLFYYHFTNTGICKLSGNKPLFMYLACADEYCQSSGAFTSPARTGLYSI